LDVAVVLSHRPEKDGIYGSRILFLLLQTVWSISRFSTVCPSLAGSQELLAPDAVPIMGELTKKAITD
jgi:hypothetical protein